MSDVPTVDGTDLLARAWQVDRVCDSFEARWVEARDGGDGPCIEDFLKDAPEAIRHELLQELVALDVHHRRKRGVMPRCEDYASRFPALASTWLAGCLGDAPSSSAPLLGRTIGSYELLEELGRGGMGVVFKARQLGLNRTVALKMILFGQLASSEDVQRFCTEAEAVAGLDHPHIVQIHEVGEHEGQPFFSMKLIEGGSLADRVAELVQHPRIAAQMLATAARAVHYAHLHGIIHRDLKPANLLLALGKREPLGTSDESEGSLSPLAELVPHIADFGLARRIETEKGISQTGTVLGTPSYMAPEQAAGQKGLTTAVDVYSLGAILYECLTGQPPFCSETPMETLREVLEHEPPHPRTVNPSADRDLSTICLKCLEKDPLRRYASAEALAEDLQRWLKGEVIQARPSSRVERVVKWVRRRPAIAALAAMLISLTIVSFIVVTWLWLTADSARLDRERLLVRLSLDRGQALCEQGDVGRGMLWLTHTLSLVPEEDTDLQRVVRLNLSVERRRFRPLRGLLPHPSDVRQVAFRSDSRLALSVGSDDTVRLWNPLTNELLAELRHSQMVLASGFSRPQDDLVLTGCADGQAYLWRTDGRRVGEPWKHQGPVHAVTFHSGGGSALTGSADGWLRLWDTSTGKLLAAVEHGAAINAVDLSPDGTLVASAGADGIARLWKADTLAATEPARFEHGLPLWAVRFSPEGRTLLTAGNDAGSARSDFVRLWSVPTGALQASLDEGHRWGVKAVAFSPDGKWVATGGEDYTARVWDAANGKRRFEVKLQHEDDVSVVAFSPDGRTLLTGSDDRTLRLWDARTGHPLGPALEHRGRVTTAAFCPDGNMLLTGGQEPLARLWDLASYPTDLRVFQHSDQVFTQTLSPDGATLATGTGKIPSAQSPGKGEVWLWHPATGELRDRWSAHDDEIWTASFSPDGKTLLTGSRDRRVRAWDPATRHQLLELPHKHRVRGVTFSRDGRLILTGSGEGTDGMAQLWDAATGRPLGGPLEQGKSVFAVAFHPDGKTCATASEAGLVHLWDIASRRSHSLVGGGDQSRIVCLAFNHDGSVLLAGSTDRTVRRWHTLTREPIGDPLLHTSAIWASAFSSDEQTLLAGGREGNLRFWDARTGLSLGFIRAHQEAVWEVTCLPDGKTVMTSSADGTVQLRSLPAPLQGSLKRLTLWAQVMTGMELDANQAARWLDATTWRERRRQLDALGGPP